MDKTTDSIIRLQWLSDQSMIYQSRCYDNTILTSQPILASPQSMVIMGMSSHFILPSAQCLPRLLPINEKYSVRQVISKII